MDEAAKKTALRMIPYGLFVMTVKDGDSMTGAAVNWLTQASFAPPLVVLGAKADNPSTQMIANSGKFLINVLESGQVPLASAFFKHVEPEGNKLGGAEFEPSPNGLPILKDGNYVAPQDMPAVRSLLRAAAFTYLAGALISLVNLARWIRLLR